MSEMDVHALMMVVSVLLSLAYIIWVFQCFKAWKRIKRFSEGLKEAPRVSVIVCMRNESSSITDTLKAMAAQDYPRHQFELIVADDFSEDDSVEKAQKFGTENPGIDLKILKATAGQKPGKKFALAVAVSQAQGAIIALTDADCTFGNCWLKTMVSHHQAAKAELTAGPVRLTGTSFFEQMQKIEFMSLSGITGSAIQWKKPLMVNAANMMFNKQSFMESGRMSPAESSASGDDTFFMIQLLQKNAAAVSFCKNENAIVSTPALTGFREFIQQRIRWASKTKKYPSAYIRLTGMGLFTFHLLIILLFLLSLVNAGFLMPAFLLLLSKWIADGILLVQYQHFYKINSGSVAWIATLIVHPVYMTLIPLLALKRNYKWKGRLYRT
jgi:cellulose synthase/poly-beta-1,6-N-acetylglucosamine synthase-like glycosyltransferase